MQSKYRFIPKGKKTVVAVVLNTYSIEETDKKKKENVEKMATDAKKKKKKEYRFLSSFHFQFRIIEFQNNHHFFVVVTVAAAALL